MFDAPGDVKPIINLRPLLELPEWFHAVRMFRDQGTTKPMADLLQPLVNRLDTEKENLFEEGKKSEAKKLSKQASSVRHSVDWLEKYAFAYESALPLELEKASKRLIDPIKKLPKVGSAGLPPLVDELTDAIVTAADKSAFPKPPSSGGNWKSEIPLDENELKRQADMIDLYLERGQLSLAVGLMREWVVSWAIWKSDNTEKIKDWLSSSVRHDYEGILGVIGRSYRKEGGQRTMTSEQKNFRTFWNQLTDNLRNALHHHAMRPTALEKAPKSLATVQNFWNRLRKEGLEKKGGINLPPLD